MSSARDLYRTLFARPSLYRLNRALFHLSLSGLGILNYQDDHVSGERHFVTRVLPRLVRPEPVFFDVGANVGTFASMLLTEFPQATVHAFEPHPRNYARLQSLGTRYNRVKCHNVALGDAEGTATLYDRADGDGSSHASLHESVISELHGQGVVEVGVRVVTLDTIAEEQGVDYVDYLKIDTEGHELAVLKGAARLLAGNRIGCIQFEFNEMNVVSRVFLRDFRKILAGYDLFRLLPRGLLPLDESPLQTELFAYQNIVALGKGVYPAKVR